MFYSSSTDIVYLSVSQQLIAVPFRLLATPTEENIYFCTGTQLKYHTEWSDGNNSTNTNMIKFLATTHWYSPRRFAQRPFLQTLPVAKSISRTRV